MFGDKTNYFLMRRRDILTPTKPDISTETTRTFQAVSGSTNRLSVETSAHFAAVLVASKLDIFQERLQHFPDVF